MQQQLGFLYDFADYMNLNTYEDLLLMNFRRVDIYFFFNVTKRKHEEKACRGIQVLASVWPLVSSLRN